MQMQNRIYRLPLNGKANVYKIVHDIATRREKSCEMMHGNI
jgi:hypothetical protein